MICQIITLVILGSISIVILYIHNFWVPVRSEKLRKAKYYKLLHVDEVHEDVKYHMGLVRDPKKVTWYNSSGLYFTDKRHIRLHYDPRKHIYIREVYVPKQAKFYQGAGEFKASELVLGPKYKIKDAQKWLEQEGIIL